MMTYAAAEQLVMDRIPMGSTWEFYVGDEPRGEFYWLVVEPGHEPARVDMWRVGPRGSVQKVMSVSEFELRRMGYLLAKHQGRVREYTPEEHEARLDNEIDAIKKGMGL